MRSDIEAGDITAEDVLSVLPFNNTVDLVELSGKDIIKVDTNCRCIVFIFICCLLQVLEWNVAGLCPNMSCEPAEFYQMAGIRVELEVAAHNQGARVAVAELRTDSGSYEPLEDDRIYNVAITSFLTQPGKSPVAELMKKRTVGPTDFDALIKHSKNVSPIYSGLEQRIQIEYS